MRHKIESLLSLAITAPSGDNCQPWRFAVNESQIDLYNEPSADTSYYNYLQRASLVAHGALLENIEIAAPTLGLKSVIQLFPDHEKPDHVAKIVLVESTPLESDLAPFIEKRTTNRKKYTGRLLDDNQAVALVPDHQDLPKVSTFVARSRSEIDVLSQVISLSDRLVFETRPLHEFLFEHIRWSDQEAEAHRDGLDIKTLELNILDTLGFKLLKSWAFTSVASKFGVSKAVAGNARKLANSASAVGVILGQGTAGPVTYLEGGRLMQRIWLQATKMGLSFHPMTGISFLMQRVAEQQADEMLAKHQELIRGAVQKIALLSNTVDPIVVGLFRVGTAAEPSARSLRKRWPELLT